MELTYNNMLKYIKDYFAAIAAIDPNDSKAEAKIRKYFAPDFKARHGWPAMTSGVDGWVNFLLSGDEYHLRHVREVPPAKQPEVHIHGPSPLHMFIDEKTKMAAIFTRQQLFDRKTGELAREHLIDVHLGFTLIGGEIKLAWEIDSCPRAAYSIDAIKNRRDTMKER